MIKKIIIILLTFLLLVIVGLIALISNKDKDKVLKRNISDSINDYRFYDEIESSIDYNSLFDYLCYNNNYKSIPVTENYKEKYKNSISKLYGFEIYNTEMYNYVETAPNQLLTFIDCDYISKSSFIVELLILKSVYDDYPKLNRKLFFNYTVDDRGFVDDIEFIREEVYREDDGTPIIRSNNRKFDDYPINYFEYLVLGLDYLKYDKEEFGEEDGGNYQDIEWEMKEFALTDNLKTKYDLNKGLIPSELKNSAYKSCKRIKCNIFSKDFLYQKNATVPIQLYFDDRRYAYNLSYSITDDCFLDDIFIEKQ